MPHQKINSLQLLRAIAVGFVVFVHSAYFGVPIISSINPTDSFYNLKTWGTIGVDLFFTISGFIMTIVIPAYMKPKGWKDYFAKRMIRIIPLYYLLSVLDALVTVYVHHEALTFQVIIKSLIFFPVFDTHEFVRPLISVGWSLSYEMYFYTLIGIFLVFQKDIYRRLLLVILVLGIAGYFLNPENPLLKFLMSPILFEFGFGIICGLIYKKYNLKSISISGKKILSLVLVLMGIGLMSWTIFANIEHEIHSGAIQNNNTIAFYRAIIWGIPCALFLLGTVFIEQSFKKRIHPIIILAGDASYSCYLIHMQMLPIFAYIFKYLSLGPILYLIAIIPLCLASSIVFYKIIERPLITGIDKLLKYRRPVIMN